MSGKTQRLDKFLSTTTGLTRSLAKKALHRGEVSVNGVVEKNSGRQVASEDQVCWLDQPLVEVGLRYLLLNKPVGYECSSKSSHHPLVTDLLQDLPALERINPVGRLDVDTSGLMLLTDDGQWLHRITSPRHRKPKVYRALLAEPLVLDAEQRVLEGLLLEGEDTPTLPAILQRLEDQQVRLTITEGRYHQVRRMFAALGNHVQALHREAIGDLWLNESELAPGQWRELTQEEVQQLGAAG
ncbi:pseudouridine synthase [Marinospirillum alkaliphilum]|uniref:Pseudouridine synthase n=1 Tax=Marinospirillum alkaliphilum DSM 21637 TaxID=1122209 RepID=A0A1K1UFQ2_9GAMM|nr:pseudouridine synthase [Marinospirillum alkaliphilum]SFX11897.1 16S rRNA pseudouridine516 synthase [Marinospirillum alkaliphilum DSM 21637]